MKIEDGVKTDLLGRVLSRLKAVSSPSPKFGMECRFLMTREPLGPGRWGKALILTIGKGGVIDKLTTGDSSVEFN
jgi:hypothetical protein